VALAIASTQIRQRAAIQARIQGDAACPDLRRGGASAICVRSGVRRALERAHLDAATQCLRRLRRPPDRGIFVCGLDQGGW
jgi:hypothetical protein